MREKALRLAVLVIALHSIVVGVALLAFPEWSTVFGGWGPARLTFFVRQGGVFHLVLATGYLLEYHLRRGVQLLVVAKVSAFVFLLSVSATGAPWIILVSGVTDGLMGAVILALCGGVRTWSRG